MFAYQQAKASYAGKSTSIRMLARGAIRIIVGMRKALILGAMIAAISTQHAHADCFDDAAQYHSVNPWILRAIAYRESKFNPRTVHHNSNKSTDLGMMGINSVHSESLAKYGVGPGDLMDGCKSVYVGAWRLRQKVNRHGNTCNAIGAYNSETPKYRDAYVIAIREVLAQWGIPLNC